MFCTQRPPDEVFPEGGYEDPNMHTHLQKAQRKVDSRNSPGLKKQVPFPYWPHFEHPGLFHRFIFHAGSIPSDVTFCHNLELSRMQRVTWIHYRKVQSVCTIFETA
jgi:hypothetical protein